MRDEPRRDAAAGVRQLRALGVQPVMLSSDNRRTAEAVAADVGLDAVAGLLPQDKVREINALRGRGPVVMVGDGINGAPSQATADVGIAMGGAFNVALEIGDPTSTSRDIQTSQVEWKTSSMASMGAPIR